ncbi:MAG: hypothetical protein P8X57_00690, partial [Cyclobacteriaceae bacterium]
NRYELYSRKAVYIDDPHAEIWAVLYDSHRAVDSVLTLELAASRSMDKRIMTHDKRGRRTQNQFSPQYAEAYSNLMNGMVERRMHEAIEKVADFWYTCWIDAGLPELMRKSQLLPDSSVNHIKGVHPERRSIHQD